MNFKGHIQTTTGPVAETSVGIFAMELRGIGAGELFGIVRRHYFPFFTDTFFLLVSSI